MFGNYRMILKKKYGYLSRKILVNLSSRYMYSKIVDTDESSSKMKLDTLPSLLS